MAWVDPVEKDEIFTTTETAESVGIHPVTLRRWLAAEELQRWLKVHNKRPLHAIAIKKGGHAKQHHIWQFGNQNRTDLREFLRERREGPREEKKPILTRIIRLRMRDDERRQNAVFRRYAKALVELQKIGFAPQSARLVQITRNRRVDESAVLRAVLEDFYLAEDRRAADELGRMFAPAH